MNKLAIIAALMAALMAVGVSAFVDVTYHFNIPNVEVAAYDILNSGGSAVAPFSGSFLAGTTTTNSTITIRFPDTLATPFGYALYYVSSGYVPLEAVATWN